MHEALVSYLYDEATPEETRDFRAHLNECSPCRAEYEAFGRVRETLQQWQLEDVPAVRVVARSGGESKGPLSLIKELLAVMPLWSRVLGAAAAAILVLAVMGTEVSVGSGGVSLRFDLLRRDGAQLSPTPRLSEHELENVRAEIRSIVNTMLVESELKYEAGLSERLASFETQIQSMQSSELARLSARLREAKSRLTALERDVDRRQGLDLTDILFGELIDPSSETTNGRRGSD